MAETRDIIVLTVGGVVAFVLQLVLAPYITIGAAMPNFVMAFVFLCAIMRAQSFGCVLPFACGLLYDFLSGSIVGAMAFSLTLFAVIAARVYDAMANDTLFMPLAVMGVGILLSQVCYGLFLLAAGYNAGFLEAFVYRALPCTLYTCVISFVLYPLAAKLFTPSGPSSPIVANQFR